MKKNNRRPAPTMPRHESSDTSEPPSPAALIERRKAEEAASRNPLAFAMGEPLPGRSALDKLRATQRAHNAAEAGVGDNVIEMNTRARGRTATISPGVSMVGNGGRKAIARID